jgi:hypothetical protein
MVYTLSVVLQATHRLSDQGISLTVMFGAMKNPRKVVLGLAPNIETSLGFA